MVNDYETIIQGLFLVKKILLLDNYDSFTYNLYQLIGTQFEGEIIVKRNDAIGLEYIENSEINGLIISPGPKKPKDIPFVKELIQLYFKKIPVLGICLGMQCINEVFGGSTVRALYPMHGKAVTISHSGAGLFQGLPENITVARYHSLVVKVNSDDLIISAKTVDNVIMGIQHKRHPLWGVQFHPESFLTEYGDVMIGNFLNIL